MGYVDKPVLVVTGTLREGMVLDGNGVEVIAAGSDQDGLRRTLAQRAPHVAGIVSFGMCGAIDPSMRLGDWVIGRRLIGSFHAKCDEAWVKVLQARLPGARVGAVHCDGHLMSEAMDKAARAWASAALVVDMESHIAAEAASHANIPFAILRCVSDRAEDQLPPAVEVMMKDDGGIAVGAVMKSLIDRPNQIGHFAHTVYGFAQAYRELGNGARELGCRLGFDERMSAMLF
ncbi:hypothetical protein GTZ99_14920 [Novosphingobium sp. FSY-8]|uniref:Nucleoside phosphorylase domain-containing protein n=1 Tax=Novosphingobium ovatum TaxID=1908523 RepID=A0ABW9XH10_9SPHN|nr:hypothetical protein [Novosphingobium ovatum]NBC37845.1 hypothetical protein [Novosphingobium ovatum]